MCFLYDDTIVVPAAGGVVRLGSTCKKYASNTSSEQFLFVLKLYSYLGIVSNMLIRECKPIIRKEKNVKHQKSTGSFKGMNRAESLQELAEIVPGDSAVYVSLEMLELKLLELVQDWWTCYRRSSLGADFELGYWFHWHTPNFIGCGCDILKFMMARYSCRVCGDINDITCSCRVAPLQGMRVLLHTRPRHKKVLCRSF